MFATTIAVIATLIAAQPATASTPEASEEPVTVTVFGDIGVEVGEQVPVEDLISAAEGLGQDITSQLGETSEGAPSRATDLSSLSESSVVLAAQAPWDEVNRWNDNLGVLVVLRYGNGTTWGWIKARDNHGVTQTMIRKTVQFPRDRSPQGSAIVYVTPAIEYSCWLGICTPVRSMDVRVVNATNNSQGVITAYCIGVTICPQWVRDAAA